MRPLSATGPKKGFEPVNEPCGIHLLHEQITGQPAESHVIVDTGSSAFVPLLHYMLSNEVQAILSQGGHQLVVHTIVTGGQALLDTLHGAAQLVKQLDAARFVIWLNPF